MSANPATHSSAPATLDIGDAAPPFVLPDHVGKPAALYGDAVAGHAVVVVFCNRAEGSELTALLTALHASFHTAGRNAPRVFVVLPTAISDLVANQAKLGLSFSLLADPQRQAARAYGLKLDGASSVVVIDHNLRIASIGAAIDPAAAIAAARDCVTRLAALRSEVSVRTHAPVLVLPRVLNREECARLIEVWHRPVKLWHSDGFRSTGYQHETGDFKIRIDTYGKTDQFVIREPALLDHLDERVMGRVIPQISKAFQQDVGYREDFRIACYDASEGGSLPAHRDNPTAMTRHRVFTVSIQLNAGEYEGGGLRFPEYGAQTYDVEPGTAIVWSCALLHEVDAVTRGRRFILGTHFFNDLAAMQASQRLASSS